MTTTCSAFSRCVALVLCLAALGAAPRTTRVRTPVRIPDIPGYKTLKCDLHTHTVFSDGSVWPDIRAEEAWREGLDAVAITDHIEQQPHRDDLPTNHERSFEIAKPRGDRLDVLVVRGSEITRKMPPGHLNAIFLDAVEPIETEVWQDAVAAAHRQGAFIFLNHPGWKGQQPDGVARWYPEHTELLEKGMLHGVEVINTREYYPEAHQWCIEKGMAILSNSDVHNPSNLATRCATAITGRSPWSSRRSAVPRRFRRRYSRDGPRLTPQTPSSAMRSSCVRSSRRP